MQAPKSDKQRSTVKKYMGRQRNNFPSKLTLSMKECRSPVNDQSQLYAFTSGMGTGPPGDVGKRAVSTSHPSSVTRRVCSNCADSFPSAVTLVQSSGHVLSRYVPKLIMGSMVKHMPGLADPTILLLP